VVEYAVITRNTDLANRMLKELTQVEFVERHTIVDHEIMLKFFKHSARQDNFPGVLFIFVTL
jgi:hypothetical protein